MLPATPIAVRPVEQQHAKSVVSSQPFVRGGLVVFAKVGLALFLTAGFACALELYAGVGADNPKVSRACVYFLSWCSILLLVTAEGKRCLRP
jgi:hypothetical protein